MNKESKLLGDKYDELERKSIELDYGIKLDKNTEYLDHLMDFLIIPKKYLTKDLNKKPILFWKPFIYSTMNMVHSIFSIIFSIIILPFSFLYGIANHWSWKKERKKKLNKGEKK